MTTRGWFPALLLAGGMLLAQEALRSYTDEEIQRHLDTFDGSCENSAIPEAEVVDTLSELEAAYQYLRAHGERLTNEQRNLKDAIVARATKGLAAKAAAPPPSSSRRKRPIVNIHSAKVLGEMGDPKGAAPLLAWLKGLLGEPFPNPHGVECGFRSLAWIGPSDKETLDLVLAYATGKHGDPSVAAAAIQACYEWRELDGETRKRFFDGICAFLLNLRVNTDDETGRERYNAVETDALQALRELGDGKTRFDGPAQARVWFERNRKWEKYVGPRFR